MRTWTIYGLVDPRTDTIRYVGLTGQTLRVRLASHITTARTGRTDGRVREWVREVLAAGLRPKAVVLQLAFTAEEGIEVEKAWIDRLPDLLNVSDADRSAAQAVGHRKRRDTPEWDAWRAQLSAAQRERRERERAEGFKPNQHAVSDETRAKLSAAQQARRAREAAERLRGERERALPADT